MTHLLGQGCRTEWGPEGDTAGKRSALWRGHTTLSLTTLERGGNPRVEEFLQRLRNSNRGSTSDQSSNVYSVDKSVYPKASQKPEMERVPLGGPWVPPLPHVWGSCVS